VNKELMSVKGLKIETVERLMENGVVSRLHISFLRHADAQCGGFTTGMLMFTKALLDSSRHRIETKLKM
jgi:aerobic-type carbon monoxide dehydrogenase small subunit (CoxS/CutS family)